MANKAAIAVVLGLAVAGTVLFATRAKAAPGVPAIFFIPTPEKIMTAATLAELDAYYEYIGELLITGQIGNETYDALYQTYVTRFNQLVGGA